MTIDYKALLQAAVEDGGLKLSEIPTIDLYMDQIITLIEDHYAGRGVEKDEKRLTKTMVNNYSKEGLIKPIKGKKYSREHIVQMLMIYGMKNTLSMQEIKQTFDGLYREEGFDGEQLLSAYETFLERKPALREQSRQLVESSFESLHVNEDKTGLLVALLEMVTLSNYLKTIAQACIDGAFPLQERSKDRSKDRPVKAQSVKE